MKKMKNARTNWLKKYISESEKTDKFRDNPKKISLFAAGLMGEAGSVLTELKKNERDLKAYPVYRKRMFEEVGDFLWYFVRLASAVDPTILDKIDTSSKKVNEIESEDSLSVYLDLGGSVGAVLERIKSTKKPKKDKELQRLMINLWDILSHVAVKADVSLEDAAFSNLRKIESRWPTKKEYYPLFDEEYAEEEQIPRTLTIDFIERVKDEEATVFLRCNGLNFGDRLTDNIKEKDGYRFHDVFHFAYAVHLGWSPVVRALMKVKRKSNRKVDEAQDGQRAIIIEEAVSATVFSRAKHLGFYDGLDQVDYDLLKRIEEFVAGYEVQKVPLWQWEAAIIDGSRLFRQLMVNRGGQVTWDLKKRKLLYTAPLKK